MKQRRKPPTKRVSKTSNAEEDPVVSELGIFVLPVHKKAHKNCSVNRLQFPQTSYPLRSRMSATMDQNDASNYSVIFKQKVKHMQILFPCSKKATHFQEETTSTSQPKDSLQKGETFLGEGFSQNQHVNHAIGCLKNGKLFLLPIDKTYEMKRVMSSNQAIGTQESLDNGRISALSGISPIRVRFARLETELQKHRRESSALFKQQEVDADTWLPLGVVPIEMPELYEKEISEVEGNLQTINSSQ